jgi:putative protein-disulfide isomerase
MPRILLIMAMFFSLAATAQKMNTPPGAFCDPETGLCTPAPVADTPAPAAKLSDDQEIIYVGDPMCSWCWGISPELNRLERAAEANGINYRIVLGGLRPDNSEEWTEKFKGFLKHHWEEVNQRSGQPFGYDLFEREHFQYNTEPSCRAVVAARKMNPEVEGRFFELTQHHFYVQNNDPAETSFYAPICKELGLNFERFVELFTSEAIKAETLADFQTNRQWGVTGYPTVIYRNGDKLYAIARGYADFERMWGAVNELANE